MALLQSMAGKNVQQHVDERNSEIRAKIPAGTTHGVTAKGYNLR